MWKTGLPSILGKSNNQIARSTQSDENQGPQRQRASFFTQKDTETTINEHIAILQLKYVYTIVFTNIKQQKKKTQSKQKKRGAGRGGPGVGEEKQIQTTM